MAPLHYESALDSGNYSTQIDMTPVRVNNAQLDGWKVTQAGWHYTLGQPGDKTTDGWVGFGGRKGQDWLKFRLARAGYLHWPTRAWQDVGGAPTYNRANLSSQINSLTLGPNNDQIPVETVATWSNLWTTPGGGSLSVSWRANGERLKEEITLNQAGRNWIAANRPPTTPLTETYFGFVFQLDWSNIPKVARAGVQQNLEGDFADDNENIEFKDSLNRLLAFMPLDNVKVPNADPTLEETQPLRKRFWKDADGNYYLLVGIRTDTLNSMAAGDLVFDPTIDAQVAAGYDDAHTFASTIASTLSYLYVDNSTIIINLYARWLNITVPQGATINVAYASYRSYDNRTGTSSFRSRFIDEDNTANFNTTQSALDGRALTDAYTDWTTGNWTTDTWYATDSIVSSLQELVNRAGWASGNAAALRTTAAQTINRYARSYEYASGSSPKLHIEYTTNQNPNTPSSLGPTSLVDGSWGSDNTPTPTFTLSDPDAADTIKYQIQIDDTSNFSSPVVDYTSALAAQGATSFTVGQAAGSGTYTTGSEGQTLSDGSYYWRVKAIDNSAAESAYSTANAGAIAFKVDATAPTTPGTPSTTSTSTDNTPTWSWTASTDSGSGLASPPYTMQWSQSSSFASGVSSTTSSSNSFTHTTSLSDGTWYFRVKAVDSVGNESSYSANGSITIDVTSPVSIDLDGPGDNSYTNSERPSFKWKATTDATSGLSKYVLEIDNPSIGNSQPSGDFTIDNIPTSRTTDYETNKYVAHYENFSDSDSTNNYISVYTKSHSDWGTSENDGKLREGRVSWKVKAVDNAGNETSSSRTLFVDRTNPKVEFTQVNGIVIPAQAGIYTNGSPIRSGMTTNDKTPTIFGKITDTLSGGDSGQSQNDNGPKIASGPKEVNIKVEQKQGLTYKLLTLYKINMDNPYYTCESGKTIDNSKQKCDKYLPFEYIPKENLELGTYKITLSGKDKADNSSSETTLTLNITTFAQITTPEEKKIVEEEIKELPKEKQEKIKEELEITKQEEPPKPGTIGKLQEDMVNATKSIFGTIGNSIATVIEGIGDGIAFTFNSIGKGLAFGADKIGNGLAFVFEKTGQGLAFVGNAVGTGYNNLANNAPGVTKNILLAIGNGVSTVGTTISDGFSTTGNFIGTTANNIGTGIHNTGQAIAQGFNNTVNGTKEGVANLAFGIGEKTQGISDSVAVAFLRVGYSLLTEPTRISGVEAVVLSPTSVKVSWKTNHPANGKVNWGFGSGDYTFEQQSDKRTTSHEFTLTNLSPDTEYHYEVMSQNKNYVYDANRTFETTGEKTLIEIIGPKGAGINVRSEPSLSGSVVTKVTAGESYQFVEEQDEWIKIQIGEQEGWIFQEYGKRVEKE